MLVLGDERRNRRNDPDLIKLYIKVLQFKLYYTLLVLTKPYNPFIVVLSLLYSNTL